MVGSAARERRSPSSDDGRRTSSDPVGSTSDATERGAFDDTGNLPGQHRNPELESSPGECVKPTPGQAAYDGRMDAPSPASPDSLRVGSSRRRIVLRTMGGLYLAFVAGVVFWPTPVDRPEAGTLARMFIWLHRHGVPIWFGYNLFEWLANVAFFVPFGVLAVLFGFRVRWAVAAACSVSTVVELSQWLFLPQRTGSVWDVLANTCGAFIGAGMAALWTRRARRAP